MKARLARATQLFDTHQFEICKRTDQMFAVLMGLQWVGGIVAAYLISPRAWIGITSRTHLHVWAAIFLGSAISALPIILAITQPGKPTTRHTIGIAQMLMGALLIHVTGGRIETHFHVFGSLAFLSFYRDWRVLVPATIVVAADHFLRGVFWPQSVYGVITASEWRWLEHTGWVLFEDTFLLIAIKRSVVEMWGIADRTAEVESLNQGLEDRVEQRTHQLAAANQNLQTEVLDRKAAEAELAKQRSFLRQVIDLNPNFIFAKDRDGRFTLVNQALADAFGTSVADLLGKTDNDLTPQTEEIDHFRNDDLEVFNTLREKFIPEETITNQQGEVLWLQTVKRPILSDDGTATQILGIATDITARKKTEEALSRSEEQLRQAQKMEAVGKLAGGVAHDFNNLLTAIIGHSEMCLRRLTREDALYSHVEQIQKAGDRAAGLTRQLLAFSRKQILQPKVIDLNSIVGDLSLMLQRLIGEDIDLMMRLAPNVGKVKADPNQVEQVLMNLAVNARDAMPNGGKLTIETSNVYLSDEFAGDHVTVASGHYVMLAVSDSGVGMDAATKARIFEPFFTTKEVGKGTGLGLSTVYGIVKQSGGSIWVYSELGSGTTFKIYLPLVADQVEQVETRRQAILKGEGTILLVEDEDVVREMVAETLKDCGYMVLIAGDGPAALDLSDEFSGEIKLMLTDVVMPQMSGRQLTEKISPKRPSMKVLYMSGYTDDAIVHHGVLEEGTAFIGKPFSPDALVLKIGELLGASQMA